MPLQHRNRLQNTFLKQLRKSRTTTTLHLLNGVRLRGTIAAFDEFCILLMVSGSQQMIYKHAISTITPSKPVDLADSNEPEASGRSPESPAG